MSKRARYHNDITQQWEYLDADAINNGTERVDVQKVKDIDNKIDVLQNDVNAHLAHEMPHQFKNADTNKTYKYGFKAQNNRLVFVYEEVI